ncbi:MAG: hypothetical protein QOC81_214 [Thermoanaerobaculia bacterium]|nr:hypothetical protein [Thermoanaerobaculia bacterium]
MSRRELVALGIVLTLVAAAFADVLFLHQAFYTRDISRIYYPERHVLRDIAYSGGFPFWNPRYGAGQPMASNPAYEVFYPPQWLALLPSFSLGVRLEIVLHFLIAALGMFVLLRSLRLRAEAAAFGAFTLALGGLTLSLTNLLPFLFSVAWMPWLAYFARRFLIDRRWRDFASAALVLGLILLIGEQSMILQSGVLLLAHALYRLRSARAVPIAAAIAGAALLVGLVQIIPALDHQRDSGRAMTTPYEMVTRWSLHPARPLELIAPNLFGRFSREAIYFWGADDPSRLPWIYSFYFGLFGAALVIAGFLHRLRGWPFIAVLSGAGYLFAIGKFGPIVPLLYRIGLGSIRYPEKWFITPAFLLIVFASIAADRYLADSRFRRTTFFVSIGLALVAAASVWFAYSPFFAQVWQQAGNHADVFSEARAGAVTMVFTAVALVLILGLRDRPILSLPLLAVFILIDLGARTRTVAPRVDDSFYDPPPLARSLMREGRPVRIFNDAEWQVSRQSGMHMAYQLAMLPEMQALSGFDEALEIDVTRTMLLPSIELSELFWRARMARRDDLVHLLLFFAGVTHVIAPSNAPENGPVDLIAIHNDRYYFAGQLVSLKRIWEPARWSRRVAFVDAPFQPAPGQILSVHESPNAIDLDVVCEGDAPLVLSVTAHRYWRATIDGAPAQLISANVGFQAVTVPRGRHHVSLRYRNPLVVICGIVSLLSAAVLVFIAAGGGLRNREPQLP